MDDPGINSMLLSLVGRNSLQLMIAGMLISLPVTGPIVLSELLESPFSYVSSHDCTRDGLARDSRLYSDVGSVAW